MLRHSSTVGSEKGERATTLGPADDGVLSRGKENLGRSRSQREYCDELSVQRWAGRRFASVNNVYASLSENCKQGE